MEVFLRKTITLLCVLCVIASVKGEYFSCKTPSGSVGNCIPLSGCQSLNELAANTFKTQEQMNYLRKSLCGSANNEPFVCCPAQSLPERRPVEVLQEIESSCQTPGGATGKCLSLNSCAAILPIVRKAIRTRSEISYLKKSKCGYANGEYMVCCPKTEFTPQTVPPTTTTSTTTTTIPKPKNIKLYPIMSAIDCRTPNRLLGQCLEIEKCPILKAIILKDTLTDNEQNLLLNSKCGANDSPTVCCPKQNEALSAPTVASNRNFVFPDSRCSAANGEPGVCKHPMDCPNMNEIAIDNQCDYFGGGLQVCCPVSKREDAFPFPTTHKTFATQTTFLPEIPCHTPGGVTGNCISIKSCTTLLDILAKETRTPFETLYLQKSQCGYVNGEFMVCCPEIPKPVFDTTTKTTTTTATSKATTITPITSTIATFLPEIPCHTPGGETGKCISIKSCTTLLDILAKETRTPFETLYIQKSQCGYVNREFMVCCPRSKSTSQTVPPATTTSTTTTTTPKPIKNISLMLATGPNIELPQGKTNKWINEEECGVSAVPFRIFGGNAVSIDEYPWAARLIYSDSDNNIDLFCGGSLIHKYYVLTAAHCVVLSTEKNDWYLRGVRLGEWNTTTAPDCEYFSHDRTLCAPQHIDIDVVAYIVHPKYQKQPFNYDIALLMLAESVTYTNFIKPICLPLPSAGQQTMNYENELVEIVGWGKTETGQHSEIKLRADLKVIDVKKCTGKRAASINQICAKGNKGTDSCNGDSGGPLMHKQTHYDKTAYYLIGVISFGLGGDCGDIQTNGMYMRVVNFMDWIVENTQDAP